MKPAAHRWTPDEKNELDRLLDAGKEATETVALSRTRQAIYARLQRGREGSQCVARIELKAKGK